MFPRLHVITDSLDVVREVLRPGVAVQIRVKSSDRLAYELTSAALPLCRAAGVLCLVDDRVGVALATGADGVHVGDADLPVAAVRRVLGPSAVIGATSRDAASARQAVVDGATYLGVGPTFPTSSKDGLPPPLGPDGLAAVVEAVPGTPVIAIAGITPSRAGSLSSYGVAAIGAFRADPAEAVRAFLAALDARPTPRVSDSAHEAVGSSGRPVGGVA